MATWREDIETALRRLGGQGTYDEIYAEVAKLRDALSAEWQATVRGTIEQASSDSERHRIGAPDVFYSVNGIGSGTWGLRDYGESTGDPAVPEPEPSVVQGRVVDAALRRAIETRAVATAIAHYSSRGALDIKELGKPYDLLVLMSDGEIHVEVKGSIGELDAVLLTRNEVAHAREWPRTELFVVDRLELAQGVETAALGGGRVRLWREWMPGDDSLEALTFQHTLPAGCERLE